MTIIGFIVCLLAVIWVTCGWAVALLWCSQSGNGSESLGILISAIVIGWAWYLVFAYAPFSVVVP